MRHPLDAIKEVCTQTYSNTLNHKTRNTFKEHKKKRQAEKVNLSGNVSSWLDFIICDSIEFRDKTQIMKDTVIYDEAKLGCVKALK